MQPQQSEIFQAQPRIRRAFSTPRLFKNLVSYRPADVSALVPSPPSTADSSGDEALSIKSKGRAQFDCNICFDAARDPVVTQCGHLYCWACLHQVCSILQFSHSVALVTWYRVRPDMSNVQIWMRNSVIDSHLRSGSAIPAKNKHSTTIHIDVKKSAQSTTFRRRLSPTLYKISHRQQCSITTPSTSKTPPTSLHTPKLAILHAPPIRTTTLPLPPRRNSPCCSTGHSDPLR